jgi:outer membrane biosynthesis protein TonB
MSTFKSSLSALILVASLVVTFATPVRAQTWEEYDRAWGHPAPRSTPSPAPTPPPVVTPEGPSLVDRCVSGVCTLIKWTSPLVWAAYEAIEPPNEKVDEVKEQKAHNAAVDKAAQEQEKSKSQEKTAEPQKTEQKSATSTPTEKTVNLKTVERKAVETKANVPVRVSQVETKGLNVSSAHTTVTISHTMVNVPRPTITVRIPTIVAHR